MLGFDLISIIFGCLLAVFPYFVIKHLIWNYFNLKSKPLYTKFFSGSIVLIIGFIISYLIFVAIAENTLFDFTLISPIAIATLCVPYLIATFLIIGIFKYINR